MNHRRSLLATAGFLLLAAFAPAHAQTTEVGGVKYDNTTRVGGWLKLQNLTGRNLQLLSVTRLVGVIGVYAPERQAASA